MSIYSFEWVHKYFVEFLEILIAFWQENKDFAKTRCPLLMKLVQGRHKSISKFCIWLELPARSLLLSGFVNMTDIVSRAYKLQGFFAFWAHVQIEQVKGSKNINSDLKLELFHF